MSYIPLVIWIALTSLLFAGATSPNPLAAIPGQTVDHIVLGSLLLAAVVAGAGVAASHRSLWDEMGQQNWTFDSWATNTAVGAGIVALVVKIVPGGDTPFTQLSAILAFIGAMAPTTYNLTTRTVKSVLKGKVFFFGFSAILTGGAVFGQLQIAFDLLREPEAGIPPFSTAALRVLLSLVAVAFVYHLFESTRDTIVAQTSGAEPEKVAQRFRLPRGGFSAL